MREPAFLFFLDASQDAYPDGPYAADYAGDGTVNGGSARVLACESYKEDVEDGPYKGNQYELEVSNGSYYVLAEDVARIVDVLDLRDNVLHGGADLDSASC